MIPLLPMFKVNEVLAARLPQFLGPWSGKKTTEGQSNPTFILKGKNKSLVLRRKPDGNLLKSAHMVEREYVVMKSLYDTQVPVPKVFYLSEDVTEIGNVYFVMDYIDGFMFNQPELPKLTREQRARVYDEMNFGLASLHKIDPEGFGLVNYGAPGNYFQRQLSVWSRQFSNSFTER